jgi:hypothetical protein
MTYGMKRNFLESAIHSFKNQTYFLKSNQVFFLKIVIKQPVLLARAVVSGRNPESLPVNPRLRRFR